MNYQQIAADIVRIAHHLYERRMLFAADGNISALLPDGTVLITPSGCHKGFITVDDLCRMTMDGEVLQGKPSSETPMHLDVYKHCPTARAVIHAHPPHAIAWSIARPEARELPADCMSEVILAIGGIPVAPFAMPGSEAMGERLRPFLPESRAIILARHGAIAWGETLWNAYMGMERLENAAEIVCKAEAMGGVTPLPAATVQKLKELRAEIGNRSL